MAETTFDLARRSLIKTRLLDLIRELPNPSKELPHRDTVLRQIMSQLIAEEEIDEGELPASVDAAVSLGLALLPEGPSDYLVVLCAATEFLCNTGQLERVRLIAPRFLQLSESIWPSRPYLAEVLHVFYLATTSDAKRAAAHAAIRLGIATSAGDRVRVEKSTANLVDVLLLTGLRRWLSTGFRGILEEACSTASRFGEAEVLSVAELLIAYADAIGDNLVQAVIHSAAPMLIESDLQEYFDRLEFATLFSSQRHAIQQGALNLENQLVALPTSSGKTFVAELRILASLRASPGKRAIYLAPYRMLGRQVERELRKRLRYAGIAVRDLGASFDLGLGAELSGDRLPEVSVMTPERLDSLMRLAASQRPSSGVAQELLNSLCLVVIDESQLIARTGRGPRLELVITRFRQSFPDVQLFCLAALVGDMGDLAHWIDADEPITNALRPTSTQEVVWGVDGNLRYRFEDRSYSLSHMPRENSPIDSAARLILTIREEFYPVLAVENTRPNAERLAQKIQNRDRSAGSRWRDTLSPVQREDLLATAELVAHTLGGAHPLASLVVDGIAFHHAGLPVIVLSEVERLLRDGALRALVATTTVAEGADLPFRVVVIPHLTFGSGDALERELYQNIIGRAGRANVSIEGNVFVLDSNAKTLRGHVEQVLWNRDIASRLTGKLLLAVSNAYVHDHFRARREVKSQLLAWLSDEQSFRPDQAQALAERSFTWLSVDGINRTRLVAGVNELLEELEQEGLAEAASPFKLTGLGRRAVLSGLGTRTCLRLERFIRAGEFRRMLAEVNEKKALDHASCQTVATIAFQAEEVIEHSAWFKSYVRGMSAENSLLSLEQVMNGHLDWPEDDSLYRLNIDLLADWIAGDSFLALGERSAERDADLFPRTRTEDRAGDVAEQIGRLTYPASWVWSGFLAMLGSDEESSPHWVRSAIELGVPTETSVELIERFEFSRPAALEIARQTHPSWDSAREMLMGDLVDEKALSKRDLRIYRDRILFGDSSFFAP